ncbi:hypothetical protein G7Y89_g7170 [Cudoniella acicularis]|uniref:Uncharacterized protein n=1 Tax=Cudoniella acicularis TaxID=354080 RepID=A0A8H4RKY2_9HELO|nr:hypothetical protein G7Y89_g7170 [Cudoniella acicularis]
MNIQASQLRQDRTDELRTTRVKDLLWFCVVTVIDSLTLLIRDATRRRRRQLQKLEHYYVQHAIANMRLSRGKPDSVPMADTHDSVHEIPLPNANAELPVSMLLILNATHRDSLPPLRLGLYRVYSDDLASSTGGKSSLVGSGLPREHYGSALTGASGTDTDILASL